MTTMEEQADISWTDTKLKPILLIKGFEVTTANCADRATARALAERRIWEIKRRLVELKAERTVLNRHKHVLERWLKQTIGKA